jgi:hypothetical protein
MSSHHLATLCCAVREVPAARYTSAGKTPANEYFQPLAQGRRDNGKNDGAYANKEKAGTRCIVPGADGRQKTYGGIVKTIEWKRQGTKPANSGPDSRWNIGWF